MHHLLVDRKSENIQEVLDYIRDQSETISARLSKLSDRGDGERIVIKTKLISNIHPVRKFLIAKLIQEKCGDLKISVVEEDNIGDLGEEARKLKKEIF